MTDDLATAIQALVRDGHSLQQICAALDDPRTLALKTLHIAALGRPALVDRFDNAAGLAAELQAWLEGARRQEEARAVVARAEGKAHEAAALRAQAATLRAEAVAVAS